MADGRTTSTWARAGFLGAVASLLLTVEAAREIYDRLAAANLFGTTLGILGGALMLGAVAGLWAWRPKLRVGPALIALATLAALLLFVSRVDPPAERIHFVQYGLVACLAWLSLEGPARGSLRFLAVLAIVAAVGVTDETVQELVPRRGYTLRDVGIDVLAGGLALAVLLLFRLAVREPTEDTGPPP